MLLNLVLAGVNGVCVYINYRSWKISGSKWALGFAVYSTIAGLYCLSSIL